MNEPKYRRVLLKISGEALAGDAHRGLNFDVIGSVCDVVKQCVEAGVQVGIVVGGGDGTFRPEMAVTRAQAAVMLCGYAAFAGRDVTARADFSAFGDAADIPAWAQAEMQWANAEKLILGRDGKLLAPNAAATRAEMASILSGYAAA